MQGPLYFFLLPFFNVNSRNKNNKKKNNKKKNGNNNNASWAGRFIIESRKVGQHRVAHAIPTYCNARQSEGHILMGMAKNLLRVIKGLFRNYQLHTNEMALFDYLMTTVDNER